MVDAARVLLSSYLARKHNFAFNIASYFAKDELASEKEFIERCVSPASSSQSTLLAGYSKHYYQTIYFLHYITLFR